MPASEHSTYPPMHRRAKALLRELRRELEGMTFLDPVKTLSVGEHVAALHLDSIERCILQHERYWLEEMRRLSTEPVRFVVGDAP